jgi:hypothetical protein
MGAEEDVTVLIVSDDPFLFNVTTLSVDAEQPDFLCSLLPVSVPGIGSTEDRWWSMGFTSHMAGGIG